MKIRLSELRDMIRKMLGRDELALYTYDESSHLGTAVKKVILYSPAGVFDDFTAFMTDSFLNDEDDTGIVKGYARFQQPELPCNGAWEVTSIAGRGLGKILYGLGYSLTPSNRLMPDRHYTSGEAAGAWKGAATKGLKGIPLDDESGTLTPDNKEDDCELQKPIKYDEEGNIDSSGGPDPLLDVAYEGGELDSGQIEKLLSAHEKVVDELENEKKLDREDFEAWLRKAGSQRFQKDFGY
ncbi:MAG: hypothetical protein FJ077_09350 [Cyanobacteria bacterium K_DeepCast_35m_m2_023]|nr:hypothetical protein [Cyanobacteria bacterium K_DeepCast_35m_m2_023]